MAISASSRGNWKSQCISFELEAWKWRWETELTPPRIYLLFKHNEASSVMTGGCLSALWRVPTHGTAQTWGVKVLFTHLSSTISPPVPLCSNSFRENSHSTGTGNKSAFSGRTDQLAWFRISELCRELSVFTCFKFLGSSCFPKQIMGKCVPQSHEKWNLHRSRFPMLSSFAERPQVALGTIPNLY